MKYIKHFNESSIGDFWEDPNEYIKGTYTINSKGLVDVTGNVYITEYKLYKLPFKFGKVSGNFDCSNNNLTTLEGCPYEVGGKFWCYGNNLTSLIGGPSEVGGGYHCSYNKLTNLKGSPRELNDYLRCYENQLTSLEGCPNIKGDFECFLNKLYNFQGIGEIGGNIDCGPKSFDKDYNRHNPVFEIYRLCPTKEFIKYLNEFTPIRGKTILGKRLQECLYMCDVELDVNRLKFKNYTLLE